MKIEIPTNYRLLRVGEMKIANDLFFQFCYPVSLHGKFSSKHIDNWRPTLNFNNIYTEKDRTNGYIYIRNLPTNIINKKLLKSCQKLLDKIIDHQIKNTYTSEKNTIVYYKINKDQHPWEKEMDKVYEAISKLIET